MAAVPDIDSAPVCIVATDLDATLLDREYDLEAAAAAVDVIDASGALTVLASSKTLAEMSALARCCARPPALVFENGAGLAWPADMDPCDRGATHEAHCYRVQGPGYPALRERLEHLRETHGFRFRGFGDFTVRNVADLTGLPFAQAGAARRRLASEPILWEDGRAAFRRFREILAQHGLVVRLGGHFHHVMPDTDKADAVRGLRDRLARKWGRVLPVIACGDAPNDARMLADADVRVVFPGPRGARLRPEDATTIHAPGPGPAAWLASVRDALRRLEAAS